MKVQKGFTLIEMMVVVAIIGILAAISLQGYTQYMTRAANRACLAEGRAFITQLNLAQANSATYPVASTLSACKTETVNHGSGNVINENTWAVTFYPKAPGFGAYGCYTATLICNPDNQGM